MRLDLCRRECCELRSLVQYSRFFLPALCCFLFFFNDTATTEIYTLSLHDALPIYFVDTAAPGDSMVYATGDLACSASGDRKSTRLNSSHQIISYAVFCLKKKKSKTKKRAAARSSPTHSQCRSARNVCSPRCGSRSS